MARRRSAIHGHDFEPSGDYVSFPSAGGGTLEVCRWCRWPLDEHPNAEGRTENRHIVAVMLDDKRSAVWDA